MASIDARGHTIPTGTDAPDAPGALADLSLSIRDVIQVDNTTARGAVVSALTAAGQGPSATNPVYVHRTDAPPGRELEVSKDGTTWTTIAAGGSVAMTGSEVVITPSAANVPTSVNVTFPAGLFAVAPLVQVTANTSVPGTSVTGVGYTNVTTSGCTIWCTRSNTNATNVGWLATEIA